MNVERAEKKPVGHSGIGARGAPGSVGSGHGQGEMSPDYGPWGLWEGCELRIGK